MNNQKQDQFDEDLKNLFQRTQPNRVPVEVGHIIENNATDNNYLDHAILQRRKKLRIRTTIFVGLAASLALLLQIPFVSNVGLAFADVQAELERIRTVDYVEIATSKKPDTLPEGVIDTRYGRNGTAKETLKKLIDTLEMKLEASQGVMRKDVQFRLNLLKPLLTKKESEMPDDVRRVRIKGKHLQRTDHLFPFDQFHGVTNAKDGKTVSFNHRTKTKETLTTQVTINDATGETTEREIKVSPAVDFFRKFRAIPADATKQLPLRNIDGQDVIGFQSVEKEENGTWTRTYWVHPESKLPIQIVTEFESTRERLSSSRWVQSHFVFDVELDDDLFSTATPKGYSAKDGRILGIEL